MKALLTKIEAYNVSCNGKVFSDMRVVSRWEGFIKLESTNGNQTMILVSERGPLETSISEALSGSFLRHADPLEYQVIKGTLDVLAAFIEGEDAA